MFIWFHNNTMVVVRQMLLCFYDTQDHKTPHP
jgi:hypothetical protein